MTLQSIWCIDMVGEITINDLNLLLESVIVVPTMTLEYVQFCDLVIPWLVLHQFTFEATQPQTACVCHN